MSLTDFLTTVVEILDEARVPYMLTGSLAAAHYALPRATQDIDFIVDVTPEQIDHVVDRLLDKGFYVDREAAFDAYRTRSQFNAIDPEQGWKLDLMIRKDRPFSVEEFGRRRLAVILDVEISLTSLEDLILAKLEWSRAGESDLQRRDVLNLVEAAGDSIDRVYVEHWAAALGLLDEWNAILGQRSPGDEPGRGATG